MNYCKLERKSAILCDVTLPSTSTASYIPHVTVNAAGRGIPTLWTLSFALHYGTLRFSEVIESIFRFSGGIGIGVSNDLDRNLRRAVLRNMSPTQVQGHSSTSENHDRGDLDFVGHLRVARHRRAPDIPQVSTGTQH